MDDSALDAREHIAQAAHVEEAGCGIGPRRAQQHVVGLVAAQHVVDEVGGDRDLAAGFLLARETALDQAGDDRAVAKCALHQRRFGEPGFEIVAEHVFVEQSRQRNLAALEPRRDVAKTPDRERIFVGHEAKRFQSRAFEAARQQHAERLMR